MASLDDVHPRFESVLSDISDGLAQNPNMPNLSEKELLPLLKQQYGLDLTEIDDETAEEFADAWEAGDGDTLSVILEEFDVPEDEIEAISEFAFESASDDDDETEDDEPAERTERSTRTKPTENGQNADYVTRAELEELKREMPTADDIASKLKRDLQQPAPSGGSGGDQNQMQSMLAQTLAQKFLAEGSGGGQMAEVGQKFQAAAMNSFLKKLSRPTMGEIIEMKMMEDVAEEYADKYKDEFFGDPQDAIEELREEDESDDDESGGLWGLGI